MDRYERYSHIQTYEQILTYQQIWTDIYDINLYEYMNRY